MITSDMASYLEDVGMGTAGTDLFAETLPSEVDTALALVTYSGELPGMVHNHQAVNVENRAVQILSRAPTHPVAEANAAAAAAHLLRLYGASLGTRRVVTIRLLQQPFQLHRDEADRPVWVCNLQVGTTKEA